MMGSVCNLRVLQKGRRFLRLITIEGFVDELSSVSDTNRLISNPYRNEVCQYNLIHYFRHIATNKIDIMLIGEAPGYRGCALTGIPFTDEAQLRCPQNNYAIGAWPRHKETGKTSERSASAMWSQMRKYHITPLMWNVFPFHPYYEGKIKSNRTPTKAEINEGIKYIDALISIFSIKTSQIFAIGKKASSALEFINDNHCIRHPANDFKKEFQPQFESKIGVLYHSRIEFSTL